MTKRTKYFFFDLGNTLIHKRGVYETIRDVLMRHQIDLSLQYIRTRHCLLSQVVEFPDKTDRIFYENFNKRLLEALGVVVDKNISDEIYDELSALRWVPYEDVAALSGLDAPLGIISNWDDSLCDKVAKLLPVDFSLVIGSQSAHIRKPDPRLYVHALERAGCAAKDAVFIGDSIMLDYEPAHSVGMQAFLIDRYDVYPFFNGNKLRSLNEVVTCI